MKNLGKLTTTAKAIRKGDIAHVTRVAEKHVPKGGIIYRILKRFGAATPPYTLTRIGSSVLWAPLAHACLRALIAVIFLCVAVYGTRNGAKVVLFVCLPYAGLYFALALFSIVYRMEGGGRTQNGTATGGGDVEAGDTQAETKSPAPQPGPWAYAGQVNFFGLFYQAMASLALWMLPIAIFAATRNLAKGGRERNHVLKYAAYGMPAGAFLADIILLGSILDFPKWGAILPVVVEAVFITAAKMMNKLPSTADGMSDVLNMLITFIIVILALWAVVSAGLAVMLSKLGYCLTRGSEDQEEEVVEVEEHEDDRQQGDIENKANNNSICVVN